MITEAIFNIIFSFLDVLVGFLPTFTFPVELLSDLTQAFSWASWVNYYIPLDTFWTCLVLIIATWVPVAVFRLFVDLL